MTSSARWKPATNSSGAAIGGPMMDAAAVVAWPMPTACARSVSSGTTTLIVAPRAGSKKDPAALSRKATT